MDQIIEQLYALYQNHPVICTDTRKLSDGCLFFALKGERFNGNVFASEALKNGAAYAIVDEPVKDAPAERLISVPNVLEALQKLAIRHRQSFMIPVIAVAGSNGKTTTKELIAAVLSTQYKCHATAGNLNNHIGVPLTLLAMPPDTEVAVIEMGTNQPGDIAMLCELTAPTHGLLTNIGKEHLEKLIDLEGVKQEESALYRYLAQNDGCAFVNLSEDHLEALAQPVQKTVFYRSSATVDTYPGLIQASMTSEYPQVTASFIADDGLRYDVRTNLFGKHNFQNILTAIALGIYFRVVPAHIQAAIETYRPQNNRSQVVLSGSNTIWLDAYNANPSSMEAALDSLEAMDHPNKAAILGDMLEAGTSGQQEHQAIVEKAEKMGLVPLVFVGPIFGACDLPDTARHFDSASTLKEWLETAALSDTLLLVKGSRGIQLEKALPAGFIQNAAAQA
jgi:UDP-N-acetylmuramoyl-tripeptide--D-alanyl-D-alanine ligase